MGNCFYILISIINIMMWGGCKFNNVYFISQETVKFFLKAHNRELSQQGRMEFINVWYLMIIVNDILIIIGSAIKEEIERKVR